MNPIRVLIADDQQSIRAAFRIILDAQPDISVVGEAQDGVIAVEQARRLRPDVVLVDVRMPRMDGLEVTRALAGPDVTDPMRVVVVTTFDIDEYVHTALRNVVVGLRPEALQPGAPRRGRAGGGVRRCPAQPPGDRPPARALLSRDAP